MPHASACSGRHGLRQAAHAARAGIAASRGRNQVPGGVRYKTELGEGLNEFGGAGGQHDVAGERDVGAAPAATPLTAEITGIGRPRSLRPADL